MEIKVLSLIHLLCLYNLRLNLVISSIFFTLCRLKEIDLHIQPDSPGLGISIVGGSGSPNGDLPVIIKRVLPKSLAEEDGRLKQGDELIAVNDTLLVGMSKDFAINALSNMHGDARLLVLQEY